MRTASVERTTTETRITAAVNLDGSGQLMSVKMSDSDPRRASPPVPLFQTGLTVSDALDQFAVARDRFLIRMPTSRESNTTSIQVIVNWKSALKRQP